ncbi:MAG: Crp/Fnr family transcriptional regulator [Bacteroidota bacterium]
MTDICYYCLQKSKATGKLDQKELERLGHNCNQVVFQKGDKILIQDALSYNIAFIKEGLVKVHAMGPEKEQILKIVKGPSYLGIPTTISAKINEYSATAISKTSVCFIGFEVFKEFIKKNGQFAYEIIVELCRGELYNFKKSINQIQKQGPGKIAEALLYFSEKIFDKQNFEIPLTRNELGDLTCSSRETVSRILSDFSKNKIIRLNKNNISILNKKQLEIISKKG